jgi:hypothetical protein
MNNSTLLKRCSTNGNIAAIAVLMSTLIPGAMLSASAAPVGTGKGIYPGRVAWVHNPKAATWNGTGDWWDAKYNSQSEYDKSFTAGVMNLSGGNDNADAWNKIFKWFNDNHGRAGTGYQAGDKIAIKLNCNNSPTSTPSIPDINANPQTAVACVRSLVNAGVPESDIWIGDPSRAVPDNVFNAIHSAFPTANVVDYFGNNGRVKTTTVADIFPNSDVNTSQSKCFYDARYLINVPLLKGHEGPGVTFGSKNLYGITAISNLWEVTGRHPRLNSLKNFMTNKSFGGKVVLWVMDAMYPSLELKGAPSTGWAEAPFNGKPMSSLIMSLDGVAEESVSFDFFYQHYPDRVNKHLEGFAAHQYMIDAAKEGGGVYDRWNNNTDRKYTRNLKPTENGIELILVDPNIATATIQPRSIRGADQTKNIDIGIAGNETVQLVLPKTGVYELSVFSPRGNRVSRITGKNGTAGLNTISIKDAGLSKGAYILQLSADGAHVEKTMQIVR